MARPVSFGDGHAILCQGDPGDRVYLLLGGAAKVAVTTVDGNRVLLGLRTRGDLVGELRLLTRCRRVASVYAAGPVRTLAVEFKVMRGWLDRHPRLGIALAESVARGLLWADQRRCDFTRPVRDRVRSLLGDLAGALGAAGEAPPSVVPLVQREIAELVGAAEVSVQKAIRELAEEGWLTRRYGHVILNPQHVAACAEPLAAHRGRDAVRC